MRKLIMTTLAACMLLAFQGSAVASDFDAAATFKKKCSICHKLDKKGMGPAILKMSADTKVLTDTITNGRKSMPTFSKKFNAEEITALVEHLVALKK
ncbi:MAG: cytochrome c [Mariprofundaceae bacterium]|nr:cytochrome c [Mariprofundaceae bacterium]